MITLNPIRQVPYLFAGIALIFCACLPAYAQNTQLDRIEIIVGNNIILGSDIHRGIRQAQQELKQQGISEPEADVLKKRVEADLIDKALQLSEADRYGLSVSEQQLIDATIAIATNNGIDLEELRRQVENQGDNFSNFLQDLREDLIIQQFQQQRLQRTVRISDEEVNRFLLTKEAEQIIGNEYLASYISLPKTPEGDTLKAEILAQLKDDANFATLAQKYSNARNALAGGSLDWRKLSELPTAFSDEIQSMQRGDVLADLERGDNQLILILDDIRGDSVEYGDEYAIEHIMIAPDEIRTEESVMNFVETLKLQIESGDSFDLMARTHSDDPTSQNEGGKLGWVLASELPKPLDTELPKLSLNQISEPLRTDEGWHIIRFTDKRIKNLTEENLRSRAVNVIFSMRYEEEISRLLKQLKEEAYIKYIYEDSS